MPFAPSQATGILPPPLIGGSKRKKMTDAEAVAIAEAIGAIPPPRATKAQAKAAVVDAMDAAAAAGAQAAAAGVSKAVLRDDVQKIIAGFKEGHFVSNVTQPYMAAADIARAEGAFKKMLQDGKRKKGEKRKKGIKYGGTNALLAVDPDICIRRAVAFQTAADYTAASRKDVYKTLRQAAKIPHMTCARTPASKKSLEKRATGPVYNAGSDECKKRNEQEKQFRRDVARANSKIMKEAYAQQRRMLAVPKYLICKGEVLPGWDLKRKSNKPK